jgi:hypothetical protein
MGVAYVIISVAMMAGTGSGRELVVGLTLRRTEDILSEFTPAGKRHTSWVSSRI